MKLWECQICGFVYDPSRGFERFGIAPNTPFGKLPLNWQCPGCGSEKNLFKEMEEKEEV